MPFRLIVYFATRWEQLLYMEGENAVLLPGVADKPPYWNGRVNFSISSLVISDDRTSSGGVEV